MGTRHCPLRDHSTSTFPREHKGIRVKGYLSKFTRSGVTRENSNINQQEYIPSYIFLTIPNNTTNKRMTTSSLFLSVTYDETRITLTRCCRTECVGACRASCASRKSRRTSRLLTNVNHIASTRDTGTMRATNVKSSHHMRARLRYMKQVESMELTGSGHL